VDNGKPGKVEIKSMYIRMPIVTYDPLVEVKLKADLVKQLLPLSLLKAKGSKDLFLEVIPK
jgi:hypothetical protein